MASKRGEVNLREASCFVHVEKGHKDESKPRPLYFNLRTSEGDNLLKASTKEDKDQWIAVLKPLCKGKHASSPPPPMTRGSSFIGRINTLPTSSSNPPERKTN